MANTLTQLAEGYAPDKGMNMAPYLPNLPLHPSLAGASGAASRSQYGSYWQLPDGRYFVPQNETPENSGGGWDDYAAVNADRTGGYKAYGTGGTPYTFDNSGNILEGYGAAPWQQGSGLRGLLDSIKQGNGQQPWGPTRGIVYNTAPEERAFKMLPEPSFAQATMQSLFGHPEDNMFEQLMSPGYAFTAGFGAVAAPAAAAGAAGAGAAEGAATAAALEGSIAAGQAGAVGAGGVLGSAGTAYTGAGALAGGLDVGAGYGSWDVPGLTGGETPWGANSGGGMDLPSVDDWSNWGTDFGGGSTTGGGVSPIDSTGMSTFSEDILGKGMMLPDGTPLDLAYAKLSGQLGQQAAKSLLGKVLSGNASASDYAQLLGKLAATGLGIYGADQQSTALSDLAKRYEGYGAPYRARLAESYADPNAFLANSPDIQASVNQGTNALARSLSTQGNPTGSGRALQELQNYATQGLYGQLGNERNRLANFGGMSSFNAASPGLAGQAIGAQGGVLNALGSGISSITNPPTTLEQALNAINGMQGLKINTGFSL